MSHRCRDATVVRRLAAGASLGFAMLLGPTPASFAQTACSARSALSSPPLVELYTSEGCSSCPPADRWLSARVAADPGFTALAFHVDYWDRLGWPDRFARPEFTQRQYARVRAAGGRVSYTPQVMLPGRVQVDWRRGEADRIERLPSLANLNMSVHREDGGFRIDVDGAWLGAGSHPAVALHVAAFADAQATDVKRGENTGRTLRHDRVALYLSDAAELPARGTFNASNRVEASSLPANPTGWIAWLERRPTHEVLQTMLLRCQASPEPGTDQAG